MRDFSLTLLLLLLGFLAVLPCTKGANGGKYNGLKLVDVRQYDSQKTSVPAVFQNNANQVASKVTRALNYAALRFPRRDPLKNLKKYTGGFNVTNTHYLASVAFVGIWGYILALLCLIFATIICCCKFCCYICGYTLPERKSSGLTAARRFIQVLGIVILVLVTLIGTAILFWGTYRTGIRVNNVRIIVFNATDFVFNEAAATVTALKAAALIISNPATAASVTSAANSLDSASGSIGSKIASVKTKVPKYLKIVLILLNLVGALIAFFALLGLVATCIDSNKLGNFSFFGTAFLLIGAWLLAGVDFTVSNVANDGCQAMDDYRINPATSSLSTVLPCKTQAQTTTVTASATDAIKAVIADTNTAITTINTNTGSTMPLICDPYGPGPGYAATACPLGTKLMSTFDADYLAYKCGTNNAVACTAANTPVILSTFTDLSSAMAVCTILSHELISIQQIMTCVFVRNAFATLADSECVPLIDSLNIVWLGYVIVGAAMMPLQAFWLFV